MYHVHVHYPGSPSPRERHTFETGAEVLAAIPKLLGEHSACEKLAVYSGLTFLFAVDCKGDQIAP